MKPCVYFLKSEKSNYYVGSTSNLNRRIEEHKKGKTKTTRRFEEIRLVRVIYCESIEEARLLEKSIKRSGHYERWMK